MKLVPVELKENSDELHIYLRHCDSGLFPKLKITNYFHWLTLKHAVSLIKPSGGLVMEIGCGEGYLMPTLSKYFDRVVAIDNSERMLNLAKCNFSFPNITYLLCDITSSEHLKLISRGKYGWIICLEVLEHIYQWKVALNNIINLMGAEGKVLLSMPVEVGLPLLVKEIGRTIFYGRSSNWGVVNFIKKLFESKRSIPRSDYRSHMGFDYREVIHFLYKLPSINIDYISFFPVNLRYLGLRVYVIFQKSKIRDKDN